MCPRVTDTGLWLSSQTEVSGTQTNRGALSHPSPSSSRAKKGQCHQLWVSSATPSRLPAAIWEGDRVLETVESPLAWGARWGTGQSDGGAPSTAPPQLSPWHFPTPCSATRGGIGWGLVGFFQPDEAGVMGLEALPGQLGEKRCDPEPPQLRTGSRRQRGRKRVAGVDGAPPHILFSECGVPARAIFLALIQGSTPTPRPVPKRPCRRMEMFKGTPKLALAKSFSRRGWTPDRANRQRTHLPSRTHRQIETHAGLCIDSGRKSPRV